MTHSVDLIALVAAGLGLALIFGVIASRLHLPVLVGYLLAGILIGPATPGFVADLELAGQLAEIGVMLLMFGVGLHFSFGDLLEVRRIAVPGALGQIAVATALAAGLTALWGWSLGAGIVFGLALSVASTVVLLRALENEGLLPSLQGRIAVGWLVVEDLAMVLALVLLPPLAGALGGAGVAQASHGAAAGAGWFGAVAITLGKVAVFVALMWGVGRRLFPWILWQVARSGSRELFTLCVIAAAVGVAYASAELFGVSFALGAFFAGMMLRESSLSHRAARESLPLREAFSVLFFVSVGMLFDPSILVREPLRVAAVVATIAVGKSLAAFAIVRALRYPVDTALTVSASLAQIGEFSFILAGLGVSLGLLPEEGRSLVLAGALISISLNPLLFRAVEPAKRWIGARSGSAHGADGAIDPFAQLPETVDPGELTGHVAIVGYGRVGRRVGAELRARGIPVVVAEQNREIVEELRGQGVHAVCGDGSQPNVLAQAHVARALALVIATPDPVPVRRMIEVARSLQPEVEIAVRTHSEDEARLLEKERVGAVFLGEHELAQSMARFVLERVAAAHDSAANG